MVRFAGLLCRRRDRLPQSCSSLQPWSLQTFEIEARLPGDWSHFDIGDNIINTSLLAFQAARLSVAELQDSRLAPLVSLCVFLSFSLSFLPSASPSRHRSTMAERYHDDPTGSANGLSEGVGPDEMNMRRMGKRQELRRENRRLSAVAFIVILQGTWEVLLVACTEGLINGGLAGLFWSYIWTFAGMTFVVVSQAEMVSMAPTSGGQYHWVSEFAPPAMQRLLSYYVGWSSMMSWQAGAASGPYLVGTLLRSIFTSQDQDHRSDSGHWEMVLIAATALGVYWCNCYGGSKLPFLQNLMLILHILGFLIVGIQWYLTIRLSP